MKKIFSLATLLFFSGAAYAQVVSGNLVGTVKDSSGALVPNATVSVRSETTDVVVTVKTNRAGEYRAPNLLPAPYDITVTAPSFSAYTLKGIAIELNKTSTIDANLSTSATAAVEVNAYAGVNLDTTSNNLTQTLTTTEITELPTTSVGYGALNAALLAPNVASSGGVGVGVGPSVGGQRPRNNNYTIEGIDDNEKSVTGPIVIIPSDATGEFTLITNQFSPEFGHSSGGQFNTTVISGTNKFHGKGYEYFQNRNLNAENAVQGGKVPNPRYDNNLYGGQIGGPIFRDKLFFFGNYQRNSIGQSKQYFFCTPTAAGLAAIAATPGLAANNVSTYEKYVPAANYLGGAQVTDVTDNSCGNQASGGQFLDITSNTTFTASPPYASNTSAGGIYGSGPYTAIPLGNYLVQAPNFSNESYITTSADYTLSSTDNFRFRYLYTTYAGSDTAANLPAFFTPLPVKQHFGSLSEFHNFTANFTNEVRVGYHREATATVVPAVTFPGLASFPNLTFFDQGGINVGPDPNGPQSGVQNLYQIVDNIQYNHGKHLLTFGFDGRKSIAPQSFTQRVRGDYQWGYLSEYLNDLAPTDFGQRSTGNFFYYGDQTSLYGYANDTWRASSKLTINIGLRYEFTSVPVGERAQKLNALASVPGLITFSEPKPGYKNFAPRVGFAYAPDAKTSIRAGFGIAYDVLFDNLGLLSFPPQYSATTNVVAPGTAGAVSVYGEANFLGGPNGGLPAGKGTLNTYPTIAAQQAATSAFVPNQVLPYAESYSLTIQRVIAKDYTFEIQYLGTRGIHLPQQNQLNVQPKVTAANQLQTYLGGTAIDKTNSYATVSTAANVNTLAPIAALSRIVPAFYNKTTTNFTTPITSYQPFGASNYNGLGLNLSRRFQHGLQFNSSYTWSKTMDNSTTEVNADALSQRRAQDSRNVAADYSRSALDRTNRFTFELVYDLPYFKNRNYLLKNLVGNWLIAPIYTYESPEYVTVISGVNSNLNGDSSSISRTIVNANGNRSQGSKIIPTYSTNSALTALCGANSTRCSANLVGYTALNPNAYYIGAGSGTLPTASRNTLPGRPVDNFDLTASKKITIYGHYGLEFQAEAFNVLNHAQYVPGGVSGIGPSNTSAASTNYLNAQNPLFNVVGKEWTAHARTMQLVGKFTF